MKDNGFSDFKLLAVPQKDPLFWHMKKLEDVPMHFLREVEHFFSIYKTLKGVTVELLGWDSQEAGTAEVRSSVERFLSTLGNVYG
jgi:inorganic pyrophosphatase